jgi:hypothetical protein
MFKSFEDFERELEVQRAKLDKTLRPALTEKDDDVAGIRCDFELPYSTLPKLQTKRWLHDSQMT